MHRHRRLYQTVTCVALLAALTSGLGVARAQAQGAGDNYAATATAVSAVESAPVDQDSGVPQEFVRRLAQRLGVSEEAVRDALRQTMGEMGPALPGLLLQLQMSQLGAGLDPGPMGLLGPMNLPLEMPGLERSGLGVGDLAQSAADVLQMDPQELRRQLQSGKSLAQIGQEHGVSPDELADRVISRAQQLRQQRLQTMVRRFLEQSLPGATGR